MSLLVIVVARAMVVRVVRGRYMATLSEDTQ